MTMLHLLEDTYVATMGDPWRIDNIAEQARLVLADAERDIAQPADLVAVEQAAHALLSRLGQPAAG